MNLAGTLLTQDLKRRGIDADAAVHDCTLEGGIGIYGC